MPSLKTFDDDLINFLNLIRFENGCQFSKSQSTQHMYISLEIARNKQDHQFSSKRLLKQPCRLLQIYPIHKIPLNQSSSILIAQLSNELDIRSIGTCSLIHLAFHFGECIGGCPTNTFTELQFALLWSTGYVQKWYVVCRLALIWASNILLNLSIMSFCTSK